MVKSLLILMLVMTQLLAGSGDSVYLCIGNDGSYSIHAESAPCAPGQVTCGSGCHSCNDASPGQQERSPCGNHPGDRAVFQTGDPLVLAGTCDCTHIPVVMASDQPTRTTRNSIAVDFEWLSSLLAQAPTIDIAYQSVLQLTFHCYDTSTVPDFTLTVVSTVVIRC